MILYIIMMLILLLVGLGSTSFEIKDQVNIYAPKEKVWATIIDFESCSEWNSQLEYSGGKVKPNGQIHQKLSADGADPYEFKPIISH